MAKNQAAWLKEPKARISVEDAPLWTPQAGEVLIKVVSAGLNPADCAQQDKGILIDSYPYILGCDVAGTVEAVGDGVANTKKGDRVIALSMLEKEYKGFQLYCLARESVVSQLPASVSFDAGTTLPLVLATAAQGLFGKEDLNLTRPSAVPDPALKGKKLLVWGGSSAVGACAVQLAARAGYTVVSTASPHNHELVRSVGAAKVFDHSDPDVVQKIHAEFGKEWVGAYDAVTKTGSPHKCAQIIGRGFIASAGFPATDLPEGVTTKFVLSTELMKKDSELARWLYHQYLPSALADGSFRPPVPQQVLRGGLRVVQEALDAMSKGVSGKKLVVRVDDDE